MQNYVNSTPNPPTDAQDTFHTRLMSAPPRGPKLQVRLYKLKELHVEWSQCWYVFDRRVQKGVDIGIAT
jgi:nijmegen breakage syndrome protein 1